MRSPRFLFVTLQLLLASIVVSAQVSSDSPPAEKDPQGIAVAQQAITAMGAATAPVADSIAEGSITLQDGTSGTITIKSKGSDRLRHDLDLGGKQLTYVVSGGQGHRLAQGKRYDLPLWVTQYQRPEHLPAVSRLADYLLPNTKVTYLGSEDVGGRPAYHIRLVAVPQDGTPAEVEEMISEFHVFVDMQTMLVVKTQSYVFSPEALQNRSPVETYYSDYRPVGGVLVPFRMVRYISGQKDREIVFSSVLLNSGVPDSEFE